VASSGRGGDYEWLSTESAAHRARRPRGAKRTHACFLVPRNGAWSLTAMSADVQPLLYPVVVLASVPGAEEMKSCKLGPISIWSAAIWPIGCHKDKQRSGAGCPSPGLALPRYHSGQHAEGQWSPGSSPP